jgi:hypothetical protein
MLSIEELSEETGWDEEFLLWLGRVSKNWTQEQAAFAEAFAYEWYRELSAALYSELLLRIVALLDAGQRDVSLLNDGAAVRNARLLAHEAMLPMQAGEDLLRDLIKIGVEAARGSG